LDLDELVHKQTPPRRRRSRARIRLRNYFLTGIVVAAPIGITIYLTWTFVHWVDSRVKPLIPSVYNPDHYLPFSVPGVGLLFAILILTLLGFMTASIVGRTMVSYGELLLDRVPLVRNLYRGLRQLFRTVLSQSSRSFQKVGLIEYPRRGVWRVGFIATRAKGEVTGRLAEEDLMALFVPNTPNVTAGFLVYVPRRDVVILDMSVEEAAKMIISAGLVAPDHPAAERLAPAADELDGGVGPSAGAHEPDGLVPPEEVEEQPERLGAASRKARIAR
jgi:uncharacterized membrane protein